VSNQSQQYVGWSKHRHAASEFGVWSWWPVRSEALSRLLVHSIHRPPPSSGPHHSTYYRPSVNYIYLLPITQPSLSLTPSINFVSQRHTNYGRERTSGTPPPNNHPYSRIRSAPRRMPGLWRRILQRFRPGHGRTGQNPGPSHRQPSDHLAHPEQPKKDTLGRSSSSRPRTPKQHQRPKRTS
jgi:hypothetical protein